MLEKRELSFILMITQFIVKTGWGRKLNGLYPTLIHSFSPSQSSWFLYLNGKTENEDSQ